MLKIAITVLTSMLCMNMAFAAPIKKAGQQPIVPSAAQSGVSTQDDGFNKFYTAIDDRIAEFNSFTDTLCRTALIGLSAKISFAKTIGDESFDLDGRFKAAVEGKQKHLEKLLDEAHEKMLFPSRLYADQLDVDSENLDTSKLRPALKPVVEIPNLDMVDGKVGVAAAFACNEQNVEGLKNEELVASKLHPFLVIEGAYQENEQYKDQTIEDLERSATFFAHGDAQNPSSVAPELAKKYDEAVATMHEQFNQCIAQIKETRKINLALERVVMNETLDRFLKKNPTCASREKSLKASLIEQDELNKRIAYQIAERQKTTDFDLSNEEIQTVAKREHQKFQEEKAQAAKATK